MSRFPDPPRAAPADIRARLQSCMDILSPGKDPCYDGLAVLEIAARAVHQASLAVFHMAEMSNARRGYDLDVLLAPVDDEELIESMLDQGRRRDNDNAGSGRNMRGPRPSDKAKADQADADGEEGGHESDGNFTTTRGARTLIEEHDLDIQALVREGQVIATGFTEFEEVWDDRAQAKVKVGVGEPTVVMKQDVREYLGRPENTGKDVSA